LALDLARGGWVNRDGWDGGFLYPKIEVRKAKVGVIEAAIAAQSLCAEHGIEILGIDADTNSEVGASQFVSLYHARAAPLIKRPA